MQHHGDMENSHQTILDLAAQRGLIRPRDLDALGLPSIALTRLVPMALSTYYNHKARAANSERLPKRVKRDGRLETEIRRVYEDNFRVYGARKVWRQMTLEGIEVARCTVERLMKRLGLQGVRRGAKRRTTISDATQQRPLDLVNRQFIATRPNQLWVADITFVATWSGFV